MSGNASIYVHLDWRIGHYVKILMDETFGEDSFRNEIIWTFGGKGLVNVVNNYVRNYNPIYFYTMSDEPTIHLKDGVVSESVMKRFGKYMSSDNQILFGTLKSSSDKLKLEKATRAFISKNGREPNDDDVARDFSEGSFIKDVWDDIPIVRQNEAYAEYANYSTQKPEKLLERIITVSSDKGMMVADFFGGSGVTVAVDGKLGRHFIHSDVGINSIQTTRDCLIKIKSSFDMYEIKDSVSFYRNPVLTMDRIKSLIPGLKNEDSLDKFWEGTIKRIKSFNLKSIQNDKRGKFKPIVISDNEMELVEYVSLDCTNSEGPWTSDHEIKIEYTSKLTIDGVKTDDYWDGKVRASKMQKRMKVRNICGDETIFVIKQTK
jgi:adenine-specific DNA-methyltransferase